MFKITLCICCCLVSFQLLAQTRVSNSAQLVTIENKHVALSFDLNKGDYSVRNIPKKSTTITHAYFQAEGLYSTDTLGTIEWSRKVVQDYMGKGLAIEIRKKFKNYSDVVWNATLYDEKDYLVFNMGIVNDSKIPFRLSAFYPLKTRNACKGMNIKLNYAVLNGNSGGNKTYVSDTSQVCCFNNVLIRFGNLKDPSIIVAGGISYNEFEKFCKVIRYTDSLGIQLFSEDPVGKLVDAGTSYENNERFYLCINNSNPFEALEKYGLALRDAQQIKLNYYDFPTECLWYASVYAKDPHRPKFNDSKGAVDEMVKGQKPTSSQIINHNIQIIPIPGASALVAATSVSGMIEKEFYFAGFLPKKKGRQTFFKNALTYHCPIVIYENALRLPRTLSDIQQYWGENTEVFIAREITKMFEEYWGGEIKEVISSLSQHQLKGEIVLIVKRSD